MYLYYDYYCYNGEKYFLLFDDFSLLVVDNKINYDDYKNNKTKLSRINALNYKKYLDEYFTKDKQYFNINFNLQGTEFQKKVWAELQNIPYGETRTYSEIACAIGSPKSARAVANAVGRNPILIFIPCHRVVGKNNKLGGFRGGVELKKYLLDLEAN